MAKVIKNVETGVSLYCGVWRDPVYDGNRGYFWSSVNRSGGGL